MTDPTARLRLVLIAAVARDRVIGDGERMPWHLPEDLRHFRATTHGHPVLMGRRTWDSLPARFRPLPGRANLVLTRDPAWRADGAVAVRSLDEALAHAAGAGTLFVIGGGEVYAMALPHADEVVLTEIDRAFPGSVRFPPLPPAFVEVHRERHRAAPPNDFDFAFVTYRRQPRR